MLLVGVISLLSLVIGQQECSFQREVQSVRQVDADIEGYGKMSFMNENLFAAGGLMVDKAKEELFEHVKVRKLASVKVDVSHELQQAMGIFSAHNFSQGEARSWLLDNLSSISAFSIAARRLQGMNFYNHVLFRLNNNFYSVEGDKLYSMADSFASDQTLPRPDQTLPQSDQASPRSDQASPRALVSSVRNQNFFIAQYVAGETDSDGQKCLSLKITQVEIKSRLLKASVQPEMSNLVIENAACEQEFSGYESQVYSHLLTFSSFQNKRTYFILARRAQIQFYFYSQKAQQLVLDQNKTINLAQLLQEKTLMQQFRILQMAKMNTHLIIATNKNNLISINLIAYLSAKRRQYLQIYESPRSETIHDIKFNDQDYRYFFIVTQSNVYQYHQAQHKIAKKFVIGDPICPSGSHKHQLRCVQTVNLLERYLIVQYRQRQTNAERASYSSFGLSFALIDKQTASVHPYKIPFTHQSKCSHHKRILFSKNKNSQYILTLACFIKQTAQTNISNNHIIFEHLNLETSDELLPQGDLGGIDFSKFRLPMIIFSIGLICYITIKRNSKKSPEKELEKQKMNQKLEEEVMQTIRREKQRQENLQALKANRTK